MQTEPKPKSARFALRAVGMFAVLALVAAALYWWGYNGYATVGEWSEPGDHASFVYEGETYYRSGVWGVGKLSAQTYPRDDLLGKIKNDGELTSTEPPATTLPDPEAETTEPDGEETTTVSGTDSETETYRELPSKVVELVSGGHTCLVYKVKNNDEFLIVWESDGSYYLYYREGTDDPLAPKETDA